MYLGARKITSINTVLNILFFIFLLFRYEIPLTFLNISITAIILMIYYIFNVFNLEKGKYNFEDFVNSTIVYGVLIVIFSNILIFHRTKTIFTLLYLFQNLTKILFYYFYVKNRNILVIGSNGQVEELKEIIANNEYYNLVGELSADRISDISEQIKKKKVSKIIITEENVDSKLAIQILEEKLKGIQVFDYLSFYEKLEEKVPVKSIDEKWILFGSGYDILYKNFNIRIKRIVDIFAALCIGLVTVPIMIISALIVKLESKGPVFFKQSRIGLGNKPFMVYKFRSMKLHNEKEHSRYAEDNDDRITKFGNFMRKTRIDELPQLWNVLIGEMSFVGPRCEWDKLCKEYEKEIPFYNIRHSVKPGLTGWAQVRYPYGASVEDAHQKLQYDLYYIKHQTLAFDLIILFKTVKIVVFGRGR